MKKEFKTPSNSPLNLRGRREDAASPLESIGGRWVYTTYNPIE
jgi:hypothetical protein